MENHILPQKGVKVEGTTYVLLEFQKERKKNETEAVFEEIRAQHFQNVVLLLCTYFKRRKRIWLIHFAVHLKLSQHC